MPASPVADDSPSPTRGGGRAPGWKDDFYGPLVVMRPPAPAGHNKGAVNYKSAVPRTEYSPRAAYSEWLAVADAVVAAGGDALVVDEPDDRRFLGSGDLQVESHGRIVAAGTGKELGRAQEVRTGRVFAANGPWMAVRDGALRAVLPNMLPHRRGENTYFEALLAAMARDADLELEISNNPHRWEGMADVCALADRVVLTYATPGHYAAKTSPPRRGEGTEGWGGKKTSAEALRGSRAGAEYAAAFHNVNEDARIYAELVYPHFHGDTVHFCLRTANGDVLVRFAGGLWGDGTAHVQDEIGARVIDVSQDDAQRHYATNSRQIGTTLLCADGVSNEFERAMRAEGLEVTRLALPELFGVAGGGPACTTLIVPRSVSVAADSPLRFSNRRDHWAALTQQYPERLTTRQSGRA